MPLTFVEIEAAKPREKPYKLTDEKGLFLLVQPTGGKLWRLKYRVHGIEKKLSIGRYPDVPLSAAREAREIARKQIAAGVDPAFEKRLAKAKQAFTWDAVAQEYYAKRRREPGKSGFPPAQATIDKWLWMMEIMRPALGKRPIDSISAVELLEVLRKVERRGNLETAKRMRSFASRVFRYAIATGRVKHDVAADLVGALTKPTHKKLGAILDADQFGGLLRAIDGYQGQPATYVALRLSPHVFVRPGELRHAEWSEIDKAVAVWQIPAAKMKRRKPHAVPLSKQALALFEEARELTGAGRYVFPSIRSAREPMSENTINGALRRLGYTGDEMTAHGFRATASTLLNESGLWHPDAIERALAHADNDAVRAAYHRGAHWEERVRMAQWWSDYLDRLRDGTANAISGDLVL